MPLPHKSGMFCLYFSFVNHLINTPSILIALAAIVIVSYLFNLLAKKTRIRSVLILLGMGILFHVGEVTLYELNNNLHLNNAINILEQDEMKVYISKSIQERLIFAKKLVK